MNYRCTLCAVAAVAAALSCTREVGTGRTPVAEVSRILQDQEAPERSLLSGNARPAPSSEMFIIGSPDACWTLSGAFLEYDAHDNVDANPTPDLLPDFAGERINTIVDSLGTPFRAYTESGRIDSLRTLAVRYSLSAIDTLSYLSRYDTLGLGNKNRAKVIILADAYLSAFGETDVDTLFKACGCGVKVMSPMRSAFEEICKGKAAPVNVGVFCKEEDVLSNVYSTLLLDVAGNREMGGSQCYAYNIQPGKGALQRFLSLYMGYGHTAQLDAVVIDDPAILTADLNGDLETIRSIMEEDSMTYGKMVSREFSVLNSTEVILNRTFRYLRDRNLFTHNIEKPQTMLYKTIPSGESYILICTNVQN